MTAVTDMTYLEPQVAPARELTATPLFRLDYCMPAWDATRIERRVIDATPETLFDVTLNTDFMDVARRSRAVRILFGMRAAAERVIMRLRSRPRLHPMPQPAMRVGSLPLRGEWVTLLLKAGVTQLEGRAEALQEGDLGQVVKVRMAGAASSVDALVVDRGRVEAMP